MIPFVYRVWRGFGLYWNGPQLTVEMFFWRKFFLGFFGTVKYSDTRYTDIGLLGVCVQITTNDLSSPEGFEG